MAVLFEKSQLVLHPQNGLGDGGVAADFLVGGGGKFAPEFEIFLVAESQTGEEEQGLLRGPAVPGLNVFPAAIGQPFVFVREIGVHELDGFADAAAIGQLKLPEIVLRRG